jgi:DNA-binding NtrC family response regulator
MSAIAERPVSDLEAAGSLFAALGRTLLCLDAACNIKYCSTPLARPGQPIADILGDELFGPLGALRQILEQGETREGWRTVLRGDDGAGRQVSLAAAPCDVDGIRYLVVVRPAEEDLFLGNAAPTFFFGVVARSPAMLDIVTLLDAVRATDVPLLFTGEEGTGKKTLARALHAASPRRAGRFVPLDCSVVSAELLSLDVARGGTLFLSHVDRLSLTLQAKLLRMMSEHETDARIVAACKTDLRRAVEAGMFREDLSRLLRTIPIEVPPLRARAEDVEPLAQHLLARVAARHGRALRLSPDTVRVLLRHTWPGNARELETAIEHAAVVAKGPTIEPDDVPPDVMRSFDDPRFRATDHGELQTIRAALDTHHWNREATARSLGMSRTTLWRKMRELRLV